MIAVIDYGMGNLRSVSKALEAVGAAVNVTSRPEEIETAGAIVLPGVGAFSRAMKNLEKLGVLPAILKGIQEGKPYLGICLGLQLLFTESEEHGKHKGFDVIKGKVKKFERGLKIPHMGWNEVRVKSTVPALPAGRHGPRSTDIFKGIPNNSYFYFVHTYCGEPEDKSVIAATTEYGREFASAVNKDNVWGVQFHPEKSSNLGLKILENFCRHAC